MFGGTAGTVTLGTPVSASQLTFSTANYILTNSTLTLTLGGTVTANANATIASVLAGTNGLTKSGTATLILNGSNIFTGDVTLNSGTLNPIKAGALPAGKNFNFNGTSTLTLANALNNYSGGTINVSAGVTANLSASTGNNQNYASATGTATSAMVWTGNGSSTLTITNLSEFDGNIACNTGSSASPIFQFQTLSDAGATNRLQLGGSLGNSTAFGFRLNGGPGVTNANRQVEIVAGTTTATHILENNSTSAWVIQKDLLNNRGSAAMTLQLSGSSTAANAFNGKIGNATGGGVLSLTKSGTGTWTLSGTNTYTGRTTLSASGGTLEVNNLANGASASALGQSGSSATNLLLGNGTTLKYTGGAASTDRAFTINGTAAGHSASLDASGSGAISFTSTASPAYGSANQTRTLILTGTSSANNTLAATLVNNGNKATSLTKNGVGTWVLSGTNTYTGTTTVSNGTLLVNGSITSAVTNRSGAVFGGTGKVTGNVGFAAGSSALFTSSGTLVITGNLVLNSNTVLLNLSNNVPAGTYTLATYSGTLAGTFNSTPTINTGSLASGCTATVTNGGGVVNLVVTSNPQPTISVTGGGPVTGQASTQNGTRTFTVTYSGMLGQTYVVQRTPDLINWSSRMTNVITDKFPVIYTEELDSAVPQMFYRVIPVP